MGSTIIGGCGSGGGGKSDSTILKRCRYCNRYRESGNDSLSSAICGVKHGDQGPFGVYLSKEEGKWLRYVRKNHSFLSEADAFDIYQQSNLRVLEKAGAFDCLKKGESWYSTLICHERVNFLRNRTKHQAISLSSCQDVEQPVSWIALFEPASREPDPSEAQFDQEITELQLAAILKLPVELQMLYWLWKEGRDELEIANSLGLFPNQVKYQKRKLSALLNKEIDRLMDELF